MDTMEYDGTIYCGGDGGGCMVWDELDELEWNGMSDERQGV